MKSEPHDQSPAARLYIGEVMHARLKPVAHRFSYRVFSVYLDLDHLRDVDRLSPVFSVGRFNLLSFEPRDHGPRDGSSLRAHADALLLRAGIAPQGGRLFLLCFPRVLGFVFNPLSIYWRFNDDGSLAAVIYEVRNTFGENHAYVAPLRLALDPQESFRQETDKAFYVSPFLDMNLRYRFRLTPPGERLSVRILETDGLGPVLAATWSGRNRPFTTRVLLRAFFAMPLLTFRIVALIHWQGLRLWLKGQRVRSRPQAPADATFVGREAAKEMGRDA